MFKPEIFTGIYRSLALLRTTILGVMAVVAISVTTFMLPSDAFHVGQQKTLQSNVMTALRLARNRPCARCGRTVNRFTTTGFFAA